MASARLKAVIKKVKDAKKRKEIRVYQKALDELGVPGRAIFICHHLHGNNVSDTARFCGVSVEVVEEALPELEKQMASIVAPQKAASDDGDG